MLTLTHTADEQKSSFRSASLPQETFLAVWRHASAYAPQAGAVRSWLLSILRHRAIDSLRALRRRSSLQEVSWEQVGEDEPPLLPDAWDEAWRSLLGSQVRAALMQIPPQQRKVIALAYFQGWTQSEIAREYGIPLGTVKARMRLGLLHLRHVFDRMGVTDL